MIANNSNNRTWGTIQHKETMRWVAEWLFAIAAVLVIFAVYAGVDLNSRMPSMKVCPDLHGREVLESTISPDGTTHCIYSLTEGRVSSFRRKM